MFDFYVAFTFDESTNEKILALRNFLEDCGYETKKMPHITIELFEGISEKELITSIDRFISEIDFPPFQFVEVDNFDKKVLYLKPDNVQILEEINKLFNHHLGKYRFKNNANKGEYKPHMTLISGDKDIESAQTILENYFNPFAARVESLQLHSRENGLIKSYDLNLKKALPNVELK